MIRVAISDDHKILIKSLQNIIEENSSEIDIAGTAGDYDGLIELLNKNIDVLIVDISILGSKNIHTFKKITQTYPGIKYIVISMHSEKEYVSEIFNAGALGYVEKKSIGENLIQAIKTVYAGNRYIKNDFRVNNFNKKIDDK